MWRHSTLIIPSLTASRQSIAASIQKLPDSVVKSAQLAMDKNPCVRRIVTLSIILRLAVDFLHAMYIKDKQMLVFNFIFDWLWTGRVGRVAQSV